MERPNLGHVTDTDWTRNDTKQALVTPPPAPSMSRKLPNALAKSQLGTENDLEGSTPGASTKHQTLLR